ncbi:MAG: SdrD B-like domain-containing protein [Chloroflexota bacterium]
MSANQDSMTMPHIAGGSQTGSAPELEYSAVRNDSLAMFGAALGGAILGMMLTLVVLAIINGGTLDFSLDKRTAIFQANIEQIDRNVGAVSSNIDAVAQRTTDLQVQLETLRGLMGNQDGTFEEIDNAIAELNATSTQFNAFVTALTNAVNSAQTGAASTADMQEAAPEAMAAPASPAADSGDDSVADGGVSVMAHESLSADSVSVMLFVDENGSGIPDDGETSLVGITVSLVDADGAAVSTDMTGDAGLLFESLAVGEYQVVVEDALGYTLSGEEVNVSVSEEAEAGQAVYIAVAAE